MFAAAAGLLVAAVVVLLVADGTTANAIALLVFGLAGVLAVSGVFYRIGRGEDEARRRGE